MYSISPFEINSLLEKVQSIGANKGEISGIQISDDLFIVYNPILNGFDFAKIVSDNDQGVKTFFFDDVELVSVDFSYTIDETSYEYKKIFFSNYFKFKNEKVNKVLSFIFTNEIILYVIAILFLLFTTLVVKVLNLSGSIAAFITIFSFICVLIIFNMLSSKKS